MPGYLRFPFGTRCNDGLTVRGIQRMESPTSYPMKRRKDGSFSTTISLEAGRTYRFKYLLDGRRWKNDWAPDGYASNSFGTEDSLVKV